MLKNKDIELTNTELNVLKLISKGYSHYEIAFRLNMQLHSVKNQISIILDKLNVKNTAQAATKAVILRITA